MAETSDYSEISISSMLSSRLTSSSAIEDVVEPEVKGNVYRKAALALPIAAAVLFVLAVVGLFSFFVGRGSTDEYGAAERARSEDPATTDTLLAFRRALDEGRVADRVTPLVGGETRRVAVKITGKKAGTKATAKKVTKKATEKSTTKVYKKAAKKATKKATNGSAKEPEKKATGKTEVNPKNKTRASELITATSVVPAKVKRVGAKQSSLLAQSTLVITEGPKEKMNAETVKVTSKSAPENNLDGKDDDYKESAIPADAADSATVESAE